MVGVFPPVALLHGAHVEIKRGAVDFPAVLWDAQTITYVESSVCWTHQETLFGKNSHGQRVQRPPLAGFVELKNIKLGPIKDLDRQHCCDAQGRVVATIIAT